MSIPSGDIEISIVMPCLNEAETLGVCVEKARRFLDGHGVSGEIVVGDNGSTDGSQDIARRLGARVIDVPVRGYGAALYGATEAARGRYVIMGDSDDSYDFLELMPFLQKLREGYDLVMGNRFAGKMVSGAMPWKNRYIGNPLLSALGRLLFRTPINDFHCGLRGFSKQAFGRMDLRTTGMEYASEMVIKATLKGLRITEVPTTLRPDGRSRPPHLRPWRDGWRHLRFMLLYSPRWLFLYPGLFLLGIGTLITALLAPGPLTSVGIEFDIHTMLYGFGFVLLGVQSVSFAVFARIYGAAQGLLPDDERLGRGMFGRLKLEHGIFVGLLLMALGAGGSVYALNLWRVESFGHLLGTASLRIVLLSVMSLTLGLQVLLNSFFLSILGLRTRRY